MSSKRMKRLLSELTLTADRLLDRPVEPKALMRALCESMGTLHGRPVGLRFRPFPDGLSTSGLKLDFPDHSTIVVEDRTTPEHQLLILGHELWHLEEGDGGHHASGAAVAARTLPDDDVEWDELLAVAARASSHEANETAAETFGLLFRGRFQSWMHGPHARGPVNQATLEGRIATALDPWVTGSSR